jgi:prevent-host-death family protein
MRFVNVRELKSKTSEILKAAAEEEVIVTSRGKPIAVVRSVSASEFSWSAPRKPATTTAALPPPSSPWSRPAPWSPPASAAKTSPATEVNPAAETRPAAPWDPLKAVFWDYPELADESGLRRYLEGARQASNQPALDWAVTRLLERGRIIDVRKLLDWKDIREALSRLRLSPFALKKWKRMREVYDKGP